jgi:glycosidase
MLRFTKTLLDLRHRDDTLRRGDINGLVASDGVLRFIRHHAGRRVMVVVNFSDTHGGVALEGRLLLSSAGGARAGSLLPAEAQVIEL